MLVNNNKKTAANKRKASLYFVINMRPANFPSNQLIAGYHLTERIGSGGMGDVYKAYHPTLNRTAAVKILHQKELAERFKNEAYIQSTVNHPNIAKLYEYSLAGDTPCIIMEYVEGETLDGFLYRKKRLDSAETENIVAQIAAALTYLHEKDILHRDIKPQNFKIQPDGKVKMLDFGISKHKFSPKLTMEGFVVGTTEYMAPEQFDQKVEKKSDIWSLGVLTYELLTGFMPFEANNPITLRSKISKAAFTDPKILVPAISENLNTIIEKSLRVNPASRMSALEIKKLLTGDITIPVEKKNEPTEKKRKSLPNFSMPKISIPAINIAKINLSRFPKLLIPFLIAIVVIIALAIVNSSGEKIINNGGKNNDQNNSTPTGNNETTARVKKINIDVPGVQNAVLVFPNGTEHKIPYEISGYEGQHIEFIIRAEGYYDKPVEFDLKAIQPYTYTVSPVQKP
jgi:serine/threonine-protein kinase